LEDGGDRAGLNLALGLGVDTTSMMPPVSGKSFLCTMTGASGLWYVPDMKIVSFCLSPAISQKLFQEWSVFLCTALLKYLFSGLL
jgi:hypothetical protein